MIPLPPQGQGPIDPRAALSPPPPPPDSNIELPAVLDRMGIGQTSGRGPFGAVSMSGPLWRAIYQAAMLLVLGGIMLGLSMFASHRGFGSGRATTPTTAPASSPQP